MVQTIKTFYCKEYFNFPVKELYLLASDNDILGIFFNGESMDKYIQDNHYDTPDPWGNQILKDLISELTSYFDGKLTSFTVPIALYGTPFRMSVYDTLRSHVHYGETISYQALAKTTGHPGAYRAVGTAMKLNPLPFIIPCHRVVHTDGSSGQYAGGSNLKKHLLSMESSHV